MIVLTACPPGLRGYLTRWFLEISAGVFVGRVSKRVRDLAWERAVSMVGAGRAIMVFSARNEQRMDFRVHGHHWTPIDIDGVSLMLRPAPGKPAWNRELGAAGSPPKTGWSKAAKRRRFGRSI
nr:type I-E CRISPR-associated endoribonuclease Cas2e [Mycetocola tolaasinivorans]